MTLLIGQISVEQVQQRDSFEGRLNGNQTIKGLNFGFNLEIVLAFALFSWLYIMEYILLVTSLKMGSSICNQQITENNSSRNNKNDCDEFQSNVEMHDQAMFEQGCTPLKNFILQHQHETPICASNNLHLNTSKQHFSEKILSFPKYAKIKQKRASKRHSINYRDKNAVTQFQEPIQSFVTIGMDDCEYGRIDISQEKFIHLRKEDIKKHYKFLQIIGQGSFGSVFRATCLKSKQQRAIKIIKKQHLGLKKSEMLSELELLKKIDHPNIIKLYEVYESKDRYQVVTELCNGGSIIDFIKTRKVFDENLVKIILKQLLGSLNYLHSLHICHRDIKLENIVFIDKVGDQSSAEDVDIKLIDFGTAFKMVKPKVKCSQLVGTVSYMAPEIIKGFFTDKCDLWSCGVIMHILLTSKSPFKCKRKEETLQKIQNSEVQFDDPMWHDISTNAKELLNKLLLKDPYKRWSASQALKHEWFNNLSQSVMPKNTKFINNLSNYYRQNNFISVIQSYLVFSNVGQEERKSIANLFKQIDKNCDGEIQKAELIQTYKEHSTSDNLEQIEHILNKIDKDGSGKINLSEFSSAMINREKLFVKESLNEAFNYFDVDGDGYIEKNELSKLLEGSDNKSIEKMMEEIDQNNDQKISKDEFFTYLSKKGCLY